MHYRVNISGRAGGGCVCGDNFNWRCANIKKSVEMQKSSLYLLTATNEISLDEGKKKNSKRTSGVWRVARGVNHGKKLHRINEYISIYNMRAHASRIGKYIHRKRASVRWNERAREKRISFFSPRISNFIIASVSHHAPVCTYKYTCRQPESVNERTPIHNV